MFEKVKEVIVEELGVEEENVTPEASIIDDLDADSLDVVELVMALEETFDIKVEDDKVQSLRTVQDVVDFIEKQKQ
ncbi:MAG: acyl carrier protein [Bacillota bacterium]